MFQRLFFYVILILMITSCSEFRYLKPSGEPQTVTRHYDPFLVSYVIYPEDGRGVIDGPYIKINSTSCEIIETGRKASINVQNLSGRNFVRDVKAGEWYYYSNNKIDSIIRYNNIIGLEHDLDTLFIDGEIAVIDSLITVVYEREVIFKK